MEKKILIIAGVILSLKGISWISKISYELGRISMGLELSNKLDEDYKQRTKERTNSDYLHRSSR